MDDGRPSGVSKHRPHHFTPKVKFTAAEDELLRALVQRYGPGDWRSISSYIGSRNPRQCRERWQNYLDPRVSDPCVWSSEEDARLLATFAEIGTQWSTLASYFPGRSTNNVKNRFVALQRRKKGWGRNGNKESVNKEKVQIREGDDSEQAMDRLDCIGSAFSEQIEEDSGDWKWFL
jgi:hypothetical protein